MILSQLSSSFTSYNWGKNHVQSCVFSVFRAVQIMNSYCLSGLIKRAQNSDSETHMKRLNPTSRTEIRRKPRKYLFLETPCRKYSEILTLPSSLPMHSMYSRNFFDPFLISFGFSCFQRKYLLMGHRVPDVIQEFNWGQNYLRHSNHDP